MLPGPSSGTRELSGVVLPAEDFLGQTVALARSRPYALSVGFLSGPFQFLVLLSRGINQDKPVEGLAWAFLCAVIPVCWDALCLVSLFVLPEWIGSPSGVLVGLGGTYLVGAAVTGVFLPVYASAVLGQQDPDSETEAEDEQPDLQL